jgi:stearoyl-CoA desaturase (delta-9 desaturase)
MAKIKSTKGLYPVPEAMSRPVGVIFFIALHIIGLVGTPWYIMRYGVAPAEWVLFWTWLIGSSMAITVGYHRLFSHATYKTNNVIRFLLNNPH